MVVYDIITTQEIKQVKPLIIGHYGVTIIGNCACLKQPIDIGSFSLDANIKSYDQLIQSDRIKPIL